MKVSKLHLAKCNTTKRNIKQPIKFQTANFLFQLILEILMAMTSLTMLEIKLHVDLAIL